jgi:quinol monooxygenase YgiN
MKFLQIIDYVTTRPDEVETLSEKFRADAGAAATTERVQITQDRDRPGHYLVIAEFPSYDAAMANSALPATQEFAARMMELCDGPPTFYNLDLVRTETY